LTSIRKPMARLRKSTLTARRSLANEMRDYASSKICKRVANSHEFMSCKSIACYLPVNEEVDPIVIIERAWRAKKRILLQ